jgi:hypothetical protein
VSGFPILRQMFLHHAHFDKFSDFCIRNAEENGLLHFEISTRARRCVPFTGRRNDNLRLPWIPTFAGRTNLVSGYRLSPVWVSPRPGCFVAVLTSTGSVHRLQHDNKVTSKEFRILFMITCIPTFAGMMGAAHDTIGRISFEPG